MNVCPLLGVLTQDYSILDMLTCSVTFWSKSEHNVGQSGIGGVYERVREWCSVWDNSPTKSAIHHSTHQSSFLFFLQHISRCSVTTRVLTLLNLLTSLFNGAFLAKDPERLTIWSVNNIDYSKKLTWNEKLELVLSPSKSIWDNTPDAK